MTLNKRSAIQHLLAAAHVDPLSFEAEVGLLVHKWLLVENIETIIEGLHAQVQALSFREDITLGNSRKRTRPSPSTPV